MANTEKLKMLKFLDGNGKDFYIFEHTYNTFTEEQKKSLEDCLEFTGKIIFVEPVRAKTGSKWSVKVKEQVV